MSPGNELEVFDRILSSSGNEIQQVCVLRVDLVSIFSKLREIALIY